jgi:hypothetical protein
MIRKYPSKKEWKRIAGTFPVKRLHVHLNDFQRAYDPTTAGPREVFIRLETMNWEMHLQLRINQLWKSYILLSFFYDMGIPDHEWEGTNEDGGTRYFPHFEKVHYQIKYEFDFYTDIFYYKISSAWDTLGHILFLIYRLKLGVKEKPSFALAIDRIKEVNPRLFGKLQDIRTDQVFVTAKTFRNAITHNFLPNSLGSDVRLATENMMTFGGRTYIPSGAFKTNVSEALSLFANTLEVIRIETTADRVAA